MPILRMDTDAVLNLSYRMNWAAAEIQQEREALAQSIFTLSTLWQGSSHDIFAAEAQQLLRTLANLSDDAAMLGRLLQAEVDQWEMAAASFGLRSAYT